MRIAVCDDEKKCTDIILNYIDEYDKKGADVDFEIITFSSGTDLLNAYKKGESFDVLFLDVEMPDISGIEVGTRVRKFDKNVIMVFITGYYAYISSSMQLGIFQYLLKPVQQEFFNEELDRIIKTYLQNTSTFQIRYKGNVVFKKIQDIIYIETYKHQYLNAKTADGDYQYVGKIKDEEKKLAGRGFVRCHQSYLLNMHYIQNYMPNCFQLTNGEEIPISKNCKPLALESFNKHMRGRFV
ncbi:MAG: LytTR family DNA-binding domain-containing protein [Oscillospiraceae bacterium]|nr:LytTR family DNA-binding domain-containing protein [Oscillospiraceae bacterium]